MQIIFKRGNKNFCVWGSSTEKITTMPMLPPGNGKIRKLMMLNHVHSTDNMYIQQISFEELSQSQTNLSY
jgi:hypothetical protein